MNRRKFSNGTGRVARGQELVIRAVARVSVRVVVAPTTGVPRRDLGRARVGGGLRPRRAADGRAGGHECPII
jgi:hypothetical protein